MSRRIFFGYPELPLSAAATIEAAAKGIRSAVSVDVQTWKDLRVGGRIVIDEVLRAIREADLSIFDVTHLNANVVYEIGYAIGRAKPVWITIDSTNASAKKNWRDFAVLNEVGYTPYRNSDDYINQFIREDPLNRLAPIYDSLIDPVLPPYNPDRRQVLYCTTFEPFEASNRLSSLVDARRQRGLKVTVADPGESGLDSLSWFAPAIASSVGVLVSFAGPSRHRAQPYNNRHALVAGLAKALEIDVLMLAEGDYQSPFDYESELKKYDTPDECLLAARTWLDGLRFETFSWAAPRTEMKSALAGLRFGEHVAENEIAELPDYFLETAAFADVVAARDTIFIGHRGTGKTANATQAFQHLAANKTNLAILIKPPGFEYAAMLQVVEMVPEHQRAYFFDSLWQFVVQTEIAREVYRKYESWNGGVPLSKDCLLYTSDAADE